MEQERTEITLSRSGLKLLIAVTMLADHIACVLIPRGREAWNFLFWELPYPLSYYLLRLVGRLAFPLVCFLLVEGLRYTHSRIRYLQRLLLFACISEIPFDLAFYHRIVAWEGQNVFFTLFLGLGLLMLMEQVREITSEIYRVRISLLLVFLAMILAYILRTDYSYWGILMILVFYLDTLTQRQRFWIFLILCSAQGVLQVFGVAALLFTEHYSSERQESTKTTLPNLFFYWFYPVHLLVLFGLQAIFLFVR